MKKRSYAQYGRMSKQILGFVLIFLLWNCQKESVEIVDERSDQNLVAQSELNAMMHDISLHDGSYDDHIDGANCLSIQFPYQVLRNSDTVAITDKEVLKTLNADEDIRLIFPIMVAHTNHTTAIVHSQEALELAAQKCIANSDSDIECIDVVYPMVIAAFDETTDRFHTLELYHDVDLYTLTAHLVNEMSMRIQYPLNLRLHDQTLLVAHSNEELAAYINLYKSSCDEQDAGL